MASRRRCDVMLRVAQEEALAFSKEHIETTCTNPKYPQCCHVFTTLCDWEQVQHLLLPKLAEYRRKLPVRPPPPLSRDNAFARHKGVVDNVRLRADLPFHRATNEESTLNTLRYCFFHMRCGIFVMIRQRRVVMFAPFVNRHYRNTWSKFLTLDHGNSLDSYYSVKRRYAQCTTRARGPRIHGGSPFSVTRRTRTHAPWFMEPGKTGQKTSSPTPQRGGQTAISSATWSPTTSGATCS